MTGDLLDALAFDEFQQRRAGPRTAGHHLGMSTCARNLPQHFNGCTCTPTPGGPSAEAPSVDLGTMMRRDAGADASQPVYDQVVAEGRAWESLQYAQVGLLLSRSDLADAEAKPWPLRRKKRTAALTDDVEKAQARVDAATRRHRHEQMSLDSMRPTDDPVAAAEHTVRVASRHADITRVAYGLARKDLALADTPKQYRRTKKVVDHFAAVQQSSHEYLAAAATDVNRARRRRTLAGNHPADGTSLLDLYQD